MSQKAKLIFIIAGGFAGLFFLSAYVYLPLIRDNAKSLKQYRQLKREVETMGKFSQDEIDSFESKVSEAISNLEMKFPPEGALKLTEQLTRVPGNANILFTEITQKQPQEMNDYQVFPVNVMMKAPFYDIIRYLGGIEKSPLVVGIDSLSLRKVTPTAELLDVRVTFLGFRLTKAFPSTSKYLEEKYVVLNKKQLEDLLQPVTSTDSESAVLLLNDYNPFMPDYVSKTYPGDKPTSIENFYLKGILQIGDKKAALINDSVLKEGEKIAGVEIVEIQNDRVIVQQSGQKYILKIGVDDAFIKH